MVTSWLVILEILFSVFRMCYHSFRWMLNCSQMYCLFLINDALERLTVVSVNEAVVGHSHH